MPRKAREKVECGIYHISIREIGRESGGERVVRK